MRDLKRVIDQLETLKQEERDTLQLYREAKAHVQHCEDEAVRALVQHDMSHCLKIDYRMLNRELR